MEEAFTNKTLKISELQNDNAAQDETRKLKARLDVLFSTQLEIRLKEDAGIYIVLHRKASLLLLITGDEDS